MTTPSTVSADAAVGRSCSSAIPHAFGERVQLHRRAAPHRVEPGGRASRVHADTIPTPAPRPSATGHRPGRDPGGKRETMPTSPRTGAGDQTQVRPAGRASPPPRGTGCECRAGARPAIFRCRSPGCSFTLISMMFMIRCHRHDAMIRRPNHAQRTFADSARRRPAGAVSTVKSFASPAAADARCARLLGTLPSRSVPGRHRAS